MLELFRNWYQRHFSDPQAVLLALFLTVCLAVILVMGEMLIPLLAAIITAYLLDGPVCRMEGLGLRRPLAVLVVFALFLATLALIVLGLLPLLYHQIADYVEGLPVLINDGQALLLRLPEAYPRFMAPEQVAEITAQIRRVIAELGQGIVSESLAGIPAVLSIAVFLVLVPLLVFFLLKDKRVIIDWAQGFMPRDRRLLLRVWREMDAQLGNYVRGKFVEVLIVSVVSYIVFALMGLSYAALFAVLVGVSVVVPFIGAVAVTLPVALAGYGQWGWGGDFAWFMIAYAVIQGLDGNLLVPLLYSEAVNLHPVAIIVAVLVFGGIWGFWGVFFAIPLATLVKSLLAVWPRV